MTRDQEYMLVALEEARKAYALGEVPVGAVLVVDGMIIARAHNLRETKQMATAHAEVLAIEEGCRILGHWRLGEATIYVTLEPCPMCAGAIYNARIPRVVYGAVDSRAGACESVFNIISNAHLNHQAQVRAGVLEDECKNILQQFFSEKR